MRNPGRSDSGDARPDRNDGLPAAEAGDDRVPADGEAAPARAPDGATAPESPVQEHAADGPDTADTDGLADPGDDLPGDDDLADEIPDFPGDDLLFDPLLSDEPIDLAAVRADDALIDALGGGDLDAAHDLVDPDDPLIAMLAAWAASARPEAEPEPESVRPPLALVRVSADERDGAEPDDAEVGDAELDDAKPSETVVLVADAEGPGGAVAAEEAEHADIPPADDPAAQYPAAHDPAAALAPAGAVRRLVPPPVLGVLDRARRARRRAAPRTRPQPAGFPLRRAGVAVVVAVIGVSGAAASGSTAKPGDAGFAMTRVFVSERAESLEAAQVVADGLARAKVYIAQRQTALAAQELAAVENRLPDVRDEEGRTLLVDQQQKLADAAALTLPAPPDPRRTTTPLEPTTPGPDPDTAILAESAPAAAVPEASTPAAAQPGETQPGATQPGAGAPAAEAPAAQAPGVEAPGGAAVVASPSQDAVPSVASAPGGSSAAAGGAGTAETPPEAATSTVSGATDQGTVTVEPTPTSGGEDTTTVTATSAPTDPTTTSRTAEPTTSSSRSTPPSRTRPSVDGGSTVATGSVPVDGAPAAVRPAAYHAPLDDPGASKGRDKVSAGGTHAAGSPLKVERTVGREPAVHPAAHRAPVVVTTVPRPAPHVDADAAAVPAHARAKSEISRGR